MSATSGSHPSHRPSWPWLQRERLLTSWSLVRRMFDRDTPGPSARRAEEEFCLGYWFPLYCFLRQSGCEREAARDYVQSFLAELLAKGHLKAVDPARGRLWNFLLTLLRRHVSHQCQHAAALKRGGGAVHVPLPDWQAAEDAWQNQPHPADNPEQAYRRALAERLVGDAIALLRERYADRAALFEALLPILEGPLPEDTYPGIAPRLNMTTAALRTAAVRFRERFRRAVSAAAAPLLGMPEGPALEAELRQLFAPGLAEK